MTVIPFVPNAAQNPRSWSTHEQETLLSIYEVMAERDDASAWAVGTTELGDRSSMSSELGRTATAPPRSPRGLAS